MRWLLGRFSLRAVGAAVAVLVAAVPTAYAVWPEKVSVAGPWRGSRIYIFVAWAILSSVLFGIIAVGGYRADRDADNRRDLLIAYAELAELRPRIGKVVDDLSAIRPGYEFLVCALTRSSHRKYYRYPGYSLIAGGLASWTLPLVWRRSAASILLIQLGVGLLAAGLFLLLQDSQQVRNTRGKIFPVFPDYLHLAGLTIELSRILGIQDAADGFGSILCPLSSRDIRQVLAQTRWSGAQYAISSCVTDPADKPVGVVTAWTRRHQELRPGSEEETGEWGSVAAAVLEVNAEVAQLLVQVTPILADLPIDLLGRAGSEVP